MPTTSRTATPTIIVSLLNLRMNTYLWTLLWIGYGTLGVLLAYNHITTEPLTVLGKSRIEQYQDL